MVVGGWPLLEPMFPGSKIELMQLSRVGIFVYRLAFTGISTVAFIFVPAGNGAV
ncbi:hypothetical protein ACVWY5_003614 [Bradyrhizobium sp. USDA 3256]